ncbi:hypothetical protein A2V71_02555 [Candidatus Berkelbacteria bacterium RBG_13_40_8]|uniref:Uncharacterized protein n=1 Tax=Candidatus Berkelbacteria bacterium RBG_13_40_8 TaxID=1797467 RepID=A0A1F5DNB1_9BACT|nr:MAG: hypothetical protein A2V71_02555 [Candidatus Berkelbacteria bacterium RBG_13_40_8]
MIPRKSITQETKNSDGLTIKGEIMPPTWISLDALGKEKKAKIPGFIIGGFWRYAFSHGVLTLPTKFYFSFKFRDKRGRSVSLNLRNFYLFVVGLSVILGIIISLLFWFIK